MQMPNALNFIQWISHLLMEKSPRWPPNSSLQSEAEWAFNPEFLGIILAAFIVMCSAQP